MKKYVAGYLFAFLFFAFYNLAAYASTIALNSCSQPDVLGALNRVADGDTITCPAGSWSWSNVSIPDKKITLQGAGIDQTTIMLTACPALQKAAGAGNKGFRITGFTFRSNINCNHNNGLALIRFADGQDWRFDHNKIRIYSNANTTWGGNAIYTSDDAAGVIDHNTFEDDPSNPPNGCWHAAVYVSGTGTPNFERDSMISAATNPQMDGVVFIEDNYFDGTRWGTSKEQCESGSHPRHAAYGLAKGSVYVFRHNDLDQANVDVHPFCSQITGREFEISKNTWSLTSSYWTLIEISAATGVIYGNERVGGSNSYGVRFQDRRISNANGYCATVLWDGIDADQTCRPGEGGEGYLCKGQVGTGKKIAGTFRQYSDPVYIWGNTGFGPVKNVPGETWIQSGRDYFYNAGAKPGYVGYRYPHPLTGNPCLENCGEGQSTPLVPNPPSSIQID